MVTRISGMTSGLDTDTLVSNLMKAARVKVDRMTQQKTSLTWTRESYMDINTKLLDFRNSKLFEFKKDSTLLARQATLGGDTNVLTAKALGNSPIGDMTIKVLQLAAGASMTGTSDIRAAGNTSFDPNQTLSSQASKLDPAVLPLQPSYTFKVNGTSIKVDPTSQSLTDVIKDINSKTNINVYYDNGSGKLSVATKDTGQNAKIDITNDTGNFFKNVLKFTSFTSGTPVTTGAQDAKVEINGILTTRSSNTFTENNVAITLKTTSGYSGTLPPDTTNPALWGPATKISVSPDADSVVKSVKDFITSYNTTLRAMQDKVNEPKYRDFPPLTDSQKSSMKDEDIKNWTLKAQSGLLRRDSILDSAVNKLRNAASSIVNNGSKYNSLASIGITAGKYKDNEDGRLYLDETKLRDAIANDPNAVASVFNKSNDSANALPTDNGFASRMYNDLFNTMTDISNKAGTSVFSSTVLKADSVLGHQLDDLSKTITAENSRLDGVQNNYYQRFANMESLLNKMNSQASYLSGLK